MAAHPTTRFTDRAEQYARWRPRYPAAVLDVVRRHTGLTASAIIADIGSGTGISTSLFLDAGHLVFAVEPNDAMRAAAEAAHRDDARFRSVRGTAEATTLDAGSVDCVVAGQAFHWFEPAAARAEFARILREPGWVVLLWNARRTDTTPFLRAYEALLLQHAIDYREVDHRRVDERVLQAFFAGGTYASVGVPNEQVLDLDGVRGRLLSSSYTPPAGDPRRQPMLDALDALFREHAEHGHVRIDYETQVHIGQVMSSRADGRT